MAKTEIKTVFGCDISPLQQGITQAGQSVDKFSNQQLKQVGGMIAGAFTAGAVISFGKKMIDNAGAISDTANAIGITTDALQALSAAGQDSGLKQDELNAKLKKLKDSQESLISGNKGLEESFNRFGISAKDAVSLDVASLLERIATGAKDNASAFSDLNNIFGKDAASQLTGLLENLADDGLEKVIQKYKELGMVIDEDYIAKLDDAGDALDRAETKINNFTVNTLGTVSDFIGDMSTIAGGGLTKAWDGIFNNPEGKFKGLLQSVGNLVVGAAEARNGIVWGYAGSGAERTATEIAKEERKKKQEKANKARITALEQDRIEKEDKEQKKVDEKENELVDKREHEIDNFNEKQRKLRNKITDTTFDEYENIDKARKTKVDFQGDSFQSIGRNIGSNRGYEFAAANRDFEVNKKIAEYTQQTSIAMKELKIELENNAKDHKEALDKIDAGFEKLAGT